MTGVIALPHTSVTTGAVGCVASPLHSTVEPVLAGTTGSVVTSIVYVYSQTPLFPAQSVYVNV